MFETGHSVGHELRQDDFTRRRRAKGGSLAHGLAKHLDHGRVGVTEQRGTVGLDEVEVATAFDIFNVGALSPHYGVGRAAHGAERSHR